MSIHGLFRRENIDPEQLEMKEARVSTRQNAALALMWNVECSREPDVQVINIQVFKIQRVYKVM